MVTSAPPNNGVLSEPCAKAMELFDETVRRINRAGTARRLWERKFLPRERAALGGSLSEAISRHSSAIHMWAFVNRVTLSRAVIEMGGVLGILAPLDVDWLLREGNEFSPAIRPRRKHRQSRAVIWS